MPIYVYRCPVCGFVFEDVRSYTDGEVALCKFCGETANRAHDKEIPIVRPDVEPYYNPSLGKYVTSRKDIREEAARLNAAVPDLMLNSYPSDGRLTKEERAELEDRETVLDRRDNLNWGRNPSGDDGIVAEGEADYDSIKKAIRQRHGWGDNE